MIELQIVPALAAFAGVVDVGALPAVALPNFATHWCRDPVTIVFTIIPAHCWHDWRRMLTTRPLGAEAPALLALNQCVERALD